MSQPTLNIADVVTPEHGEKFAEDWRANSMASGAMVKAFTDCGVVEWPDERAAQGRFHDIENEVTERVFDDIRNAVAAAFVRIADEVLSRERCR